MKKIKVTNDFRRYWCVMHREAKWTPKRPYCKLCSVIDFRNRRRMKINYFDVGEVVYRVDFPNERFGLYHVSCMEHPENESMKRRIENIKMMDIDRWNALPKLIEDLRERNVEGTQAVKEIMRQFNCSRATAYRKLQGSACMHARRIASF